jgi:hypothetical protein
MLACHAISARHKIQPCQVLSSTDEKSHSLASLKSPSSIFWKRLDMISSEKDGGSEETILETAFAAVYLTIVSCVNIFEDVPCLIVLIIANQLPVRGGQKCQYLPFDVTVTRWCQFAALF